jgi:outer membrane lipoprotein SlyB
MRSKHIILALFGVALLAGCANAPHGIGTAADKPKEVIRTGVIESVTPIQLDNSSSAGSTAGSIFGQVGGANTGGGRGAVVGSVLGTVLGGTVGHQAGIATKPGLEIWVKLDETGEEAYVMQAGNADAFKVGDRVRVVVKNGVKRVETEDAKASH